MSNLIAEQPIRCILDVTLLQTVGKNTFVSCYTPEKYLLLVLLAPSTSTESTPRKRLAEADTLAGTSKYRKSGIYQLWFVDFSVAQDIRE